MNICVWFVIDVVLHWCCACGNYEIGSNIDPIIRQIYFYCLFILLYISYVLPIEYYGARSFNKFRVEILQAPESRK